MFGLFRKKEKSNLLKHYVYMTRMVMCKELVAEINRLSGSNSNMLIIYHFDQTGEELHQLSEAAGWNDHSPVKMIKANAVSGILSIPHLAHIFVAEVHPDGTKDQEIAEWARQKYASAGLIFYTSLDAAMMQLFNSANIMALMQNMGMEENERIEHPFVSKAILNSQKKIAGKITGNLDAGSEAEWIRLNIRS